MPWKPQAEPAAALKARALSPLLGYVASRLDGATDLETLTAACACPGNGSKRWYTSSSCWAQWRRAFPERLRGLT